MKNKKIISLLLAVVMCFGFASCTQPADNSGDHSDEPSVNPPAEKNYYATVTNLFEDDKYFIADFESVDQIRQTVQLSDGLKLELCSDPAYVKHGKNSMKVTVTNGTSGYAGRCKSGISLILVTAYNQKSDFSDCDYISMDIYNSLDVPVNIGFSPYAKWECGYGGIAQPGWSTITIETWKMCYGYRTNYTREEVEELGLQSYAADCVKFNITFPMFDEYGKQVYYIDQFVGHKNVG